MNAELEAIKDAWSKDTGDGRDDASTRKLCDQYVADHPEQFEELRKLKLPDVVNALSTFRTAGMETEMWLCEVWQLHNWAPQQIGGEYQAQLRLS